MTIVIVMKEVFLVKSDNKQKVEDLLKRDDIVSRGSITIKAPASLDIKEDGYFFILDMNETAIKRAEELIKGLAEKYKHPEKVILAVNEQEAAAIEGFGNILG
jgi:hypothetical protein